MSSWFKNVVAYFAPSPRPHHHEDDDDNDLETPAYAPVHRAFVLPSVKNNHPSPNTGIISPTTTTVIVSPASMEQQQQNTVFFDPEHAAPMVKENKKKKKKNKKKMKPHSAGTPASVLPHIPTSVVFECEKIKPMERSFLVKIKNEPFYLCHLSGYLLADIFELCKDETYFMRLNQDKPMCQPLLEHLKRCKIRDSNVIFAKIAVLELSLMKQSDSLTRNMVECSVQMRALAINNNNNMDRKSHHHYYPTQTRLESMLPTSTGPDQTVYRGDSILRRHHREKPTNEVSISIGIPTVGPFDADDASEEEEEDSGDGKLHKNRVKQKQLKEREAIRRRNLQRFPQQMQKFISLPREKQIAHIKALERAKRPMDRRRVVMRQGLGSDDLKSDEALKLIEAFKWQVENASLFEDSSSSASSSSNDDDDASSTSDASSASNSSYRSSSASSSSPSDSSHEKKRDKSASDDTSKSRNGPTALEAGLLRPTAPASKSVVDTDALVSHIKPRWLRHWCDYWAAKLAISKEDFYLWYTFQYRVRQTEWVVVDYFVGSMILNYGRAFFQQGSAQRPLSVDEPVFDSAPTTTTSSTVSTLKQLNDSFNNSS